MDINELAAALSGADKEIEANNPYRGFQAVTGKVLHNPNDYSIGEDAIAGLVQGLLSGAAGSLGDTYSANAKKDYRDVLMGAMAGSPVNEADTSLSPSLFSKAEEARSLFALKRKIDKEDAQTQAVNDILKARGVSAAGELGKNDAKSIIAGNGGYDPTNDPDSPQYKRQKDILSIEDKARQDLKGGIVEKFSDLKSNFNTMVDVFKYKDLPSTRVFIQSFARVQDPGSAVRGEEISNAENTQSFLEGLGYKWNALLKGEQSLSPEHKALMIRAAADKYNAVGSDVGDYIENQKKIAAEAGGKSNNVFAPVTYKPFAFNDWIKTAVQEENIPQFTFGNNAANNNAASIKIPSVDIPSLIAEAKQLKDVVKYGKPEDIVSATRRLQEIKSMVQ